MAISRILKWIGIVTGFLLILFLLVVSYLWFIFDKDICTNTILNEVASPKGTYIAVVFDRSCGATTGFSTQVSVLAGSSMASPNQPGNTITFNGQDVPVSIVWISENEVAISSPGSKATYTIKSIKNKVSISLSQ